MRKTVTQRIPSPRRMVALLAALALLGCSHADVAPPPDSEFGLESRHSATGAYRATAEPVQPIRVGSMHRWILQVEAADSATLEGARITVDGGMPEHGHGLPTRPRVTRVLGPGEYQVDGMKFNMGGWWEVKFHIAAGGVEDTVTFHLDL